MLGGRLLTSKAELRHRIFSLGYELSDELIDEMIRKVDDKSDGLLDYKAFATMKIEKVLWTSKTGGTFTDGLGYLKWENDGNWVIYGYKRG